MTPTAVTSSEASLHLSAVNREKIHWRENPKSKYLSKSTRKTNHKKTAFGICSKKPGNIVFVSSAHEKLFFMPAFKFISLI
jgi:hypothetical protein